MNLVIDIGNTLQKIAVFQHDELIFCQSFQNINVEILLSIFSQFGIKNAIFSSVSVVELDVIDFLKEHTNLIHYTPQTPIPINIMYKRAESLGLDRIANSVGATTLFPKRNVLSIQAGTCLVFDFVNEHKEYLGGSISPGLSMRFEALHKKTKNLPLLRFSDKRQFLGTNTEESICSGVLNGIGYEIDGFITDYQSKYNDLVVILTGGDATFLQNFIKNTIFAAPYVVLIGLNEIIKNNV